MADSWQQQVVQAQQGDLTAFDRVVKQFEDMAVGYAYSLLGDFHLAEDAAQEAFVEAYFCLAGLREAGAFPAWFRKIVFKQCDRIRRKKQLPTVPLESTIELPHPGPTPLDAVMQQETHETVLSVINALPEIERAVTSLAYINGYSLAEVGEFLEVPVSTVKNRLHAARKQLKERMVGQVEDTLKSHAPGDDFSRQVTRVLEGITQFTWENTWLCFEGSLYGCLHYMGTPISMSYLMGITGGAFKFLWHPESNPMMCDLALLGEEPIKHACYALGYNYTFAEDRYTVALAEGGYTGLVRDPRHTEDFYSRRIVESIDAGHPVLARGIIPRFVEHGVVTGYDKGGKVLYGKSYFQILQGIAGGYFREEDWYPRCAGIITLRERHAPLSLPEILTDTLGWAIGLSRTSRRDTTMPTRTGTETWHYSGLAAYDALAHALLDNAYFPNDSTVLSNAVERYMYDGIWMLLQEREAAATFLQEMAVDGMSGTEMLRRAAAIYFDEAAILRSATQYIPINASEECLVIAQPSVRQELHRIVCGAKQCEEQAIQCMEQALDTISRTL